MNGSCPESCEFALDECVSKIAPEDGYDELFSGYEFNLGAERAGATTTHALSGLTTTSTVWHSVAGEGDNDGFYETTYEYDTLGRLVRVVDPSGTRTEYEYDGRSRVVAVSAGTTGMNMQTLAETFYDSGGTASQGVGDGVVSMVRRHTGESSGTEVHDTIFHHDYRNRVVVIESPSPPHAFLVYDNLDRVTKAAMFSVLPSGIAPDDIDDSGSLADRGMYTETSYSQCGIAYRQRVAIDPTDPSPTFLESHAWHDALGRVVGTWGPNGPATKTAHITHWPRTLPSPAEQRRRARRAARRRQGGRSGSAVSRIAGDFT